MNAAISRLSKQRKAGSGVSTAGFTLLELAIALAVIGVILGAVTVGREVFRSAGYQRISSTFVQGWQIAYDAYTDRTGIVPGDDPADPSGDINGDGSRLCNDPTGTNALLNTFLGAGVDLPQGRSEGRNDRYVYRDTNGNPQETQVCFETVDWAVPDGSVGSYVTRERNVMVLLRLTPSLARSLDSSIDGKPDARFGRFRQDIAADNTGSDSVQWSLDDRYAWDETTASAQDEDQVAVVTAYYLMNR